LVFSKFLSKRRKVPVRISILFLMVFSLALAGCGGGGGSSAPAPKTTAVLKIGTQGGLPAGVTGLSGVGVTITLPQGVTVATDGNGNPAANVAMVSGVAVGGSIAAPVYTAPTATTNGTLKVVVAAGSTLFGTGEFVTVTCQLPRHHPQRPAAGRSADPAGKWPVADHCGDVTVTVPVAAGLRRAVRPR